MIAQELIQIWHHIIGTLEQHLWYIVDNIEAFLPSLRVAISLNERQHKELLQRSGSRVKESGGLHRISTDQLDSSMMQEQFNLKRTKKNIASKSKILICIGEPMVKNSKAAKSYGWPTATLTANQANTHS